MRDHVHFSLLDLLYKKRTMNTIAAGGVLSRKKRLLNFSPLSNQYYDVANGDIDESMLGISSLSFFTGFFGWIARGIRVSRTKKEARKKYNNVMNPNLWAHLCCATSQWQPACLFASLFQLVTWLPSLTRPQQMCNTCGLSATASNLLVQRITHSSSSNLENQTIELVCMYM